VINAAAGGAADWAMVEIMGRRDSRRLRAASGVVLECSELALHTALPCTQCRSWVTFDRSSRLCLPLDVCFAPKADKSSHRSEAARVIAGILVDVACDLARGRVWTALRLEWTCAAVAPRCAIAHIVVAAHVAGGHRHRRCARDRT
jgi:hypothetical protein